MADADFLGSFDERQARRCEIGVAATLVRSHCDPVAVRLRNVGALGARIETPQKLSVGALVTLAVEGMPDLKAWVAWCEGTAAGLTFAHHPPAPLIESLAAR